MSCVHLNDQAESASRSKYNMALDFWVGPWPFKPKRRVRFPYAIPKFLVIRVKKARIIRKARFNVSSILPVKVRPGIGMCRGSSLGRAPDCLSDLGGFDSRPRRQIIYGLIVIEGYTSVLQSEDRGSLPRRSTNYSSVVKWYNDRLITGYYKFDSCRRNHLCVMSIW